MTKETMTIHKALCELKTLDSRILSAIEANPFVFANKHSNTKVGGVDIGEYCKEIESRYQKIKDLMARRDAIKRAVVLSNAMTTVTIGGREYTVAEAIEIKNHSIPLRQRLLRSMTDNMQTSRRAAERANGEFLESRADDYVRSMYGNSTDMKNMSEEIKKSREDFIKQQTMEIVDPLHITEESKALEESINEFLVNIDSALSVSNALTSVEIEY